MGAGKTTLGLALANRLGAKFVDSDLSILELTGWNTADIASHRGVPYLHRLERSLFVGLLSISSGSVIAAAASVVDDEATREKMSEHLCIWVEADAATLAERRQSGSHRRHMTDPEAEELNRVRRLSVAGLVIGQVDTTSSTVEQSTALAMAILSRHLPLLNDTE
jgi:shikimate kinase